MVFFFKKYESFENQTERENLPTVGVFPKCPQQVETGPDQSQEPETHCMPSASVAGTQVVNSLSASYPQNKSKTDNKNKFDM